MNNCLKHAFRLSSLGLLLAVTTQANAAGYRMEFQSASVLADSGDAAVVEDAGTNWYNSAGLVNLPRQIVFGGMLVRVPTQFRGNEFAPSPLDPAFDYVNNGRASSIVNSKIPLWHASYPLNPCWAIGLSVVPAWGFVEDYGNGSNLRYSLVRVYTRTIDIAPSLAMRINPQLSFGIGPDFHYLYVSSKFHVRTQGFPPFGTPNDSVGRYSGEHWNYGAHAGLLYQFNPSTRIGINYRTKIAMNLKGHSNFLVNGDDDIEFQNRHFRLGVPLPPTTTVSIYHEINPCWAVMGSLIYDQWSVLERYHARNIALPPTPINPTGTVPNVILEQKMRNTFDYGLGVHYRWNDRLMLRANMKVLQNPTQARFRTVTFPDGSKVGFQIGGRYQVTPCVALDALYGHVFIKKVQINDINPLTFALAQGNSRAHVDFIGGQVVWNI